MSGKQVDIGEVCSACAENRLEEVVNNYRGHCILPSSPRIDITRSLSCGTPVRSHAGAETAHLAFDIVLDITLERLRPDKRRLQEHHRCGKPEAKKNTTRVHYYAIARLEDAEKEDHDNDAEHEAKDNPIAISAITSGLETLSVGGAVMSPGLSGRFNSYFYQRPEQQD